MENHKEIEEKTFQVGQANTKRTLNREWAYDKLLEEAGIDRIR